MTELPSLKVYLVSLTHFSLDPQNGKCKIVQTKIQHRKKKEKKTKKKQKNIKTLTAWNNTKQL